MKVKYFDKALLLFLFMALAAPGFGTTNPEATRETREATALKLQSRLEEIKSLDKTQLTFAEKRALRKEVRAIKKELAAVGGGVYLSVGAILLIALLLILLL
jgi:hypothetical protein